MKRYLSIIVISLLFPVCSYAKVGLTMETPTATTQLVTPPETAALKSSLNPDAATVLDPWDGTPTTTLAIPAATASAVSAADPLNIEGFYECTGYDPFEKSTYYGNVEIKKVHDTYDVKWNYGEAFTFVGTAIIDESKNSMAAVFESTTKNGQRGVANFQIQKDDVLTDSWTYMGKNEIAHGICKKSDVMAMNGKKMLHYLSLKTIIGSLIKLA